MTFSTDYTHKDKPGGNLKTLIFRRHTCGDCAKGSAVKEEDNICNRIVPNNTKGETQHRLWQLDLGSRLAKTGVGKHVLQFYKGGCGLAMREGPF